MQGGQLRGNSSVVRVRPTTVSVRSMSSPNANFVSVV